jgi:alkylation response protein AidB-like acyl-CoA dehydrogenase
MYSFEPTEEQKMLMDAVDRYAQSDLRPAAHDAEETGLFEPRLIETGWEMGVLQASIPESYGGFGDRSVVTGVLAAEAMAWGDLAGSMAVMVPGLFTMPILLAGTEEQKEKYIPPVIEGSWQPYTAALVENTFDFDSNDLACTAVKSNGEYIINGDKTFVPFGAEAKAMIVYASLEGETKGFILPSGTQGVTVSPERQKLMGLNALPFYSIHLKDVKLKEEDLLPGDFGPILDSSRLAIASLSIGVAKAAFDYSRDYAKDRDVFGVKVAQKQAIAFMLAEMAIEIDAMRALTWEAAWMVDNGKPEASKQAYLAHTGSVDMVMMVTDRAVQILGGHGYIREHPVELFMRNGRGFASFTGLATV